jgi:hypothetical protein
MVQCTRRAKVSFVFQVAAQVGPKLHAPHYMRIANTQTCQHTSGMLGHITMLSVHAELWKIWKGISLAELSEGQTHLHAASLPYQQLCQRSDCTVVLFPCGSISWANSPLSCRKTVQTLRVATIWAEAAAPDSPVSSGALITVNKGQAIIPRRQLLRTSP